MLNKTFAHLIDEASEIIRLHQEHSNDKNVTYTYETTPHSKVTSNGFSVEIAFAGVDHFGVPGRFGILFKGINHEISFDMDKGCLVINILP